MSGCPENCAARCPCVEEGEMLQSGDLLFTRTNTFIGRAIRLFTRSDINHVAIVGHCGGVIEASFKGVRHVRFCDLWGEVLYVRRLRVSTQQQVQFVQNAMNRVGRPYDVWQILAIILRVVFKGLFVGSFASSKAHICSELVYEAAEEAGIEAPKTSKRWVTPKHVLFWHMLEEVPYGAGVFEFYRPGEKE